MPDISSYTERLREAQNLFMLDLASLIQFIKDETHLSISGGELFRPQEMQKIYFDRGLTKTIESYHTKKLAIDINYFYQGKQLLAAGITKEQYAKEIEYVKPIGQFWMGLDKSNVWGSDWDRDYNILNNSFQDPYHFEKKFK